MRFIPCFFLAALLVTTACKQDYPGQEPERVAADAPIPVRLLQISPTEESVPIEGGGTISAKEETRLSFKVGGLVQRMYADEGQAVRSGQELARLKTTEIDAQVMKARQARDKAVRDLGRIEGLYADSATTLENVQNLKTALAVAESDLEIAGFNQTYARITAPYAGRITKRLADPNELVAPGSPIFVLTGESKGGYVLRIGVVDRDLIRLAPGDRATVQLDAYPGDTVAARVTEIAAAADPRTGTFTIELELQAGERTIRNGFIGRAKVYPSRQPAHYRLPLEALVEGNGSTARIFYPDAEGLARSRRLTITGLLDDAFIVPADQLKDITTVVGAGAAYLTEGARIEERNTQPLTIK